MNSTPDSVQRFDPAPRNDAPQPGAAGQTPVILSWSGGKDSALTLAALRDSAIHQPVALLTSVTADFDRVSVHGVRRALLHAQARALDLPLVELWLEPRSSNDAYDAAFARAASEASDRFGTRRIAFGDLFLEDVRRYREDRLAPLKLEGVFPLWGLDTGQLARSFIARGFVARLVCVDTQALPASFAGRLFDEALLADFPPGVDPCGERGEFHTFVSDGPGFRRPVPYTVGEGVLRDGRFAYCDLVTTEPLMHPRTQELLDHLEYQRAGLRVAVEEVPADLRNQRPAPDRWSVAEVLEHLSIVEGRVGRMLAKKFAEARDQGVGPELDSTPILPTVDLSRALDRTRRIDAPEPSRPQGQLNADTAWEALEASRTELQPVLLSGDGLALNEITLPHPLFGPLTGYEWIAFVGGHEARHADQIREIRVQLTRH